MALSFSASVSVLARPISAWISLMACATGLAEAITTCVLVKLVVVIRKKMKQAEGG